MNDVRMAVASAVLVIPVLVSGGAPVQVEAQVPGVQVEDLPRHVASRVVDFFNDARTIRFSGRSRVPGGRTVVGDVAVLGGPFTVGGSLEGDLVVVNGDLILEDEAAIVGNVTVVGGRVSGNRAAIEGDLIVYEESLRYVYRGERIEGVRRRRPREDAYRPWGRVRFGVRAGTNYNRIEGLPVMFGPIVESGGRNPFRLDAFGVWRTDEGFDFSEEDLGYRFRAEQSFGRSRVFSLGGTIHSTIEPVERWGLSDLESSLTTLFFHKDFRDYFEQTGWSAFATFRAPRTPLRLTVDYRDEDHASVFNGSPLTLKDNDEPWRPQPVVAQGETRSVGAELEVDLRNDEEDPSDGWYMSARTRFGVAGDLALPELLEETDGGFQTLRAPVPVDDRYAAGFLDVRRYNRVGPGSELHLRGVLGGSLNGDPLPPQYQHALGGEGSLPGYYLFQADCGARVTRAFVSRPQGEITATAPAFANYGCDRIALFQAEYRSTLFFDVDVGDEDDDWSWWVPHVDLDATWAAFVDVGRGWSLSDPAGPGPDRFDTPTLVDLGLGFFLGDMGLYLAVPLDEDTERGVNFFVRLNHRF